MAIKKTAAARTKRAVEVVSIAPTKGATAGPAGAGPAAKRAKAGKVYASCRLSKHVTAPTVRRPAYRRKALSNKSTLTPHAIIKRPVKSEKSYSLLDTQNVLTYIVDTRATKPQIKQAVRQLLGKSVVKVNTLIRPDGKKKAYVRIGPECDTDELATIMGVL